jgi:hypothetical protein
LKLFTGGNKKQEKKIRKFENYILKNGNTDIYSVLKLPKKQKITNDSEFSK